MIRRLALQEVAELKYPAPYIPSAALGVVGFDVKCFKPWRSWPDVIRLLGFFLGEMDQVLRITLDGVLFREFRHFITINHFAEVGW